LTDIRWNCANGFAFELLSLLCNYLGMDFADGLFVTDFWEVTLVIQIRCNYVTVSQLEGIHNTLPALSIACKNFDYLIGWKCGARGACQELGTDEPQMCLDWKEIGFRKKVILRRHLVRPCDGAHSDILHFLQPNHS
jgi:hypothetical protein